jgi:hypothetical protein
VLTTGGGLYAWLPSGAPGVDRELGGGACAKEGGLGVEAGGADAIERLLGGGGADANGAAAGGGGVKGERSPTKVGVRLRAGIERRTMRSTRKLAKAGVNGRRLSASCATL